MIIIDTALRRRQEEGRPIRVAMVGAGAMGLAIARQIVTSVPGMVLVAIANRHVEKAESAYQAAGIADVRRVDRTADLERLIPRGCFSITDNPDILCEASNIDAILEVTGTVEFGARVALKAIEHRKHLVLMNAEMFATLGPILKVYADRAGVVITDSDGDQPGVIMNLIRFVKGIGCRPVLAGSIKGIYDPYRNPATQQRFAHLNDLSPSLATSAADGTKLSFEMAVVANATGFRVGQRGMAGPFSSKVEEAPELFPYEEFLRDGRVDYILGAEPSPGVFVVAAQDDPAQRKLLKLYKLGDGPLYTFYRPYHLCHFEVPFTVARAAIFQDAAVTPIGGPVVDVVAAAKRDLKPGERLDGLGGYTYYGLCENADLVSRESLLPAGLAEGCRLTRFVPRDTALAYADVEVPAGRLSDTLRWEQNEFFGLQQPSRAVA